MITMSKKIPDDIETIPENPPWTLFFDGPLYQEYDKFMKTKDFSKILLNTKLRLASNSQSPEAVNPAYTLDDDHWNKEQKVNGIVDTYQYVSEDYYQTDKEDKRRRARRTRAFIILGFIIMAALAFGTALVIHFIFITPLEERNPNNSINVSFSGNTTTSIHADFAQTTPLDTDVHKDKEILSLDDILKSSHHDNHDHVRNHGHTLHPGGKTSDNHVTTTAETSVTGTSTSEASTTETSVNTEASTKAQPLITIKLATYLLNLNPDISDSEIVSVTPELKTTKSYTSTMHINHMAFFGMDEVKTTTQALTPTSTVDEPLTTTSSDDEAFYYYDYETTAKPSAMPSNLTTNSSTESSHTTNKIRLTNDTGNASTTKADVTKPSTVTVDEVMINITENRTISPSSVNAMEYTTEQITNATILAGKKTETSSSSKPPLTDNTAFLQITSDIPKNGTTASNIELTSDILPTTDALDLEGHSSLVSVQITETDTPTSFTAGNIRTATYSISRNPNSKAVLLTQTTPLVPVLQKATEPDVVDMLDPTTSTKVQNLTTFMNMTKIPESKLHPDSTLDKTTSLHIKTAKVTNSPDSTIVTRKVKTYPKTTAGYPKSTSTLNEHSSSPNASLLTALETVDETATSHSNTPKSLPKTSSMVSEIDGSFSYTTKTLPNTTNLNSETTLKLRNATTTSLSNIRTTPLPNITTTPLPNITTTSLTNITTTSLPNITTTLLPNIRTKPLPNITTTSLANVTTTSLTNITTTSLPNITTPLPNITTTPLPDEYTSVSQITQKSSEIPTGLAKLRSTSFQASTKTFTDKPISFPETTTSFPETTMQFTEKPITISETATAFPETIVTFTGKPTVFPKTNTTFTETSKTFQETTTTERTTSFPETKLKFTENPTTIPDTSTTFPETTQTFPKTTTTFLETTTTFPETTKTFPETTTTFPETTKTFPETTTTYPETTTTYPETTKTLSEKTTTFPETTQTFPKTTKTFPETTKTYPETTSTFPETTTTFPETTTHLLETTTTLLETTTTLPEITTLPENYNTVEMSDVTSYTFDKAILLCNVRHAVKWKSLSVKVDQAWRPLEVTLFPSGVVKWSRAKKNRHDVMFDIINSTDGTGSNMTLTLIINDVQCRDANDYICSLKSSIENRTARSRLIVVGKPSKKISLTLGPSVIEDRAFRITASWQGGYPIPWANMSWTALDANNKSYNLADYGEYRDYELHVDHKFCQTTLKHSIVVFPRIHLNDTTVIVKPNIETKKYFVDKSMEKYLTQVQPGQDKILVIPLNYCKNEGKEMSIPHPYTPCRKFVRCLPGDMVIQLCPRGTCFYEGKQECG